MKRFPACHVLLWTLGLAGFGPLAAADDAGFARYADVALLAKAIEQGEAAFAADLALQLAEGERVLCRTHEELTADQAFAAALRIAQQTQDTATLERLTKAAQKLGRPAWSDRLAANKKLGAAARSASPQINTDHLTPEARQVFEGVSGLVRSAELSGNIQALDAVPQILKECEVITPEQRRQLEKISGAARSALAAGVDPQLQKLFSRIEGPSREVIQAGTLAISVDGAVSAPASTAPVGIVNNSGASVSVTGSLAISIPSGSEAPIKPKPGVSKIVITIKKRYKVFTGWVWLPYKVHTIKPGGFSLTGGGKQQVKML